jgi:hypothetical protein
MKLVNVIESLNVRQVPYIRQSDISFRSQPTTPIHGEGGGLVMTGTPTQYVAYGSIKNYILWNISDESRIRHGIFAEPTIVCEDYIALNPLINDTLGKYIKILDMEFKGKIQSLEAELHKIFVTEAEHRKRLQEVNRRGLWQRLKEVFKRKIY